MPLTDQINRIMRRFFPPRQRTTADEAEESRPRRRAYALPMMATSAGSDRASVVGDARRMYDEDPRIEAMIRGIAADATKGDYEVAADGLLADEAMQIADDLKKQLGLVNRLDDWLRLSLRDGESFLESSVSGSGDIVKVTRKPTLKMYRNSNKADGFDDPERAFFYSDEPYYLDIPGDAIFFARWQMTHARWNHDEGSRYGRPLFRSARRAYKRADDGEENVWIRRKTRSGKRYQHRVEGGEEKVNNYMRVNQDALDNPFAAVQDFFGDVDIKEIGGDDTIGDISDIEHHIETVAIASPLPLALIGYGRNLNRDILVQKLEQYERALEGVSRWVSDQLLMPILEVQWLLKGIWPGNLDYQINWASKKTINAETLLKVAQAGVALRALGWPDEFIIRILSPLVPGLDSEALIAAMEAAKKNQPDEIDRIASDAK